MASLVKRENTGRNFGCTCCGERVMNSMKFFQVLNDTGTIRRGERYCLSCESYARENNDDIVDEPEDDGEAHLRSMEDFGAYKAAGVSTEDYYKDRDAGLCH